MQQASNTHHIHASFNMPHINNNCTAVRMKKNLLKCNSKYSIQFKEKLRKISMIHCMYDLIKDSMVNLNHLINYCQFTNNFCKVLHNGPDKSKFSGSKSRRILGTACMFITQITMWI